MRFVRCPRAAAVAVSNKVREDEDTVVWRVVTSCALPQGVVALLASFFVHTGSAEKHAAAVEHGVSSFAIHPSDEPFVAAVEAHHLVAGLPPTPTAVFLTISQLLAAADFLDVPAQRRLLFSVLARHLYATTDDASEAERQEYLELIGAAPTPR
jgi:hypothetical protein